MTGLKVIDGTPTAISEYLRENKQKLEKIIKKDAIKNHIKLIKWLYDNHKEILREWEATQGKLRVGFL